MPISDGDWRMKAKFEGMADEIASLKAELAEARDAAAKMGESFEYPASLADPQNRAERRTARKVLREFEDPKPGEFQSMREADEWLEFEAARQEAMRQREDPVHEYGQEYITKLMKGYNPTPRTGYTTNTPYIVTNTTSTQQVPFFTATNIT